MKYEIPFSIPYFPMKSLEKLSVDMESEIVDAGSGYTRLSNGENCRQLEEKVAKLSGADFAVSCSSCTQGMVFGLGACGARGDGHTASFTWDSTAVAMTLQGNSRVHLHDIDMERWCVPDYDVGADPRAKGGYAVAVDTFGLQYNPTSMVPTFYDRAHSIGLRFRQLGLASFISFSPSKLITGGEGGMILSNREPFVKAMVKARDLMSRMTETSAIMILEGLKNLPDLLEWKRSTFCFYKNSFPDMIFQNCPQGESNHQITAMLLDSHEQQVKLKKALVDTGEIELKMYYEPLHAKSDKFVAGQLPNTESVFERIVCLPSWKGVNREQVVQRIKEVLEA
jgi:dTDP-4-amino-4,6-dideoxygalactose transaminase